MNYVSCVDQLCSVKLAPNVPLVQNLPIGARLSQFWETLRGRIQSSANVERRVHLTLPNQTLSYQVIDNHQLLCTFSQEPQPGRGIASADEQKCCRVGQKLGISLVPKPNNKWRPILDISNRNKFLKVEKFKMETPEMILTSLQTWECMTSLEFKDAYFHIPIQNQPRKYLRFHVQNIPIPSTTIWLVQSSLGVHCCGQRGQTDGFTGGYKNPAVRRRLVGPARSHQTCLQHTQTLVTLCQDLG